LLGLWASEYGIMFKERLKAEGSELVTFCHQLKMQASDGKLRNTDAVDPELSLDRARETWQKHGRSEKWIQQRMMGQETRNKLTDYWDEAGIKKGVFLNL
jgi:DNA-damage-inducible protein D